MTIIDDDSKVREIESLKKIVHKHKDIEGNDIFEDFVEVMIVGKERKWMQYYPLNHFVKLNPAVEF